MNALTPIHSDEVTGKASPPITVRDRRFGREQEAARWWLNGDPIATALVQRPFRYIPRGETLFIESVKAFRDGAPPKLETEIRAFIRQEINHTREHVAFNKAVVQAVTTCRALMSASPG